MGVMEPLLIEQPPLVLTPCPITLEGQTYLPCEVREGETLGQFLDRTVDLGADAWEVRLGGVLVPVEMWDRVKPKHGHLIEVRGAVNKQALYIVAMIALTYFTFGIGTAAGWGAGAAAGAFGGGLAGAVFAGAVFAAGALVINKVLGPKVEQPSSRERDSVYNIAGARNAVRPYEPLGLLLGSTLIAPDILSQPYTFYEGNDQYVAMVLTPGINADRFDTLYFGETPISQYEGVTVWTAGFPGMPEQDIPVYSNADTIAGGELSSSTWVNRTTSPDTVGVMVNLEYILGGTGTSGKSYWVSERVEIQYKPVGTSTWQTLQSRTYRGDNFDPKRATIFTPVPRGQYDVRVRIAGIGNYTGDNAHENRFQWTTLTSVQADDADYRGIPRIGIKIKATGQLNGTPDQIRAVFHGGDMPMWTGTAWGTATDRASGLSNPGALILAYARGFRDENGDLIAGMGLSDADIDIPALQAFMTHCRVNGYTYDHWQQGVRSHQEVLDSIALAGFGEVSWAPGKLTVMWAGQSQPLTGVVNMATMKRGQFQVDYTLVGGADGVEYTYFDRSDWSAKTLRVPAPGVVTMLNPARLTGEGVTTEANAAKLARYHLAQSLYQYKDISYSTDLEHLTYRRLSMLSLQHDLTKWGHGGRLRGASSVGGVVSIALDEPVPAPASGDAYIGLRVPSEGVYRVFKVAPFSGETTNLTLVEPWPADVPLPGSTEANPAHDTIWIYDFKTTPGYRVRVVSIEPEAGMKGARVAVVPEPPEFWEYVETGHYDPPVDNPPANSRPVASNLVVSERQVVQGDTEYTELTATFDLSGYAAYSVVYAALMPGGVLEEVAQTSTRTASWRIPEAGEYAVVVRPFDAEGNVGTPVSGTYITSRADNPPPVFDLFEVQSHPGGIREYWWGYYGSTMQAANLAGAEIRYVEGKAVSPVWEDMTPLGGGDGFFASAVQTVTPPAGQWTFAIRARNTSGILSVGMTVITRTLADNLGELVGGITQQMIDQQEAIDQAAYDAAQAQAAAAEALALQGTRWEAGTAFLAGTVVFHAGRMYRAIQASTGVEPPNAAYWQYLGTVTEVQGTTAQALSQLRVDLDEQGNEFAAAITQVQSGQTGSGNRLEDAEQTTTAGGHVAWDALNWKAATLEVNLGGESWRAVGTNNYGLLNSGVVAANESAVLRWTKVMACEPGDNVIASARLANHRSRSFIRIVFLDAAGAEVGIASSPQNTAMTGGPELSNWFEAVVGMVAPAGAAQVFFQWWTWGLGQANPYAWITQPQLELARPDQTQPSPWAPAATGLATATLALKTAQDAQITLTTNVNGHVSGMYSKNDGQTGVIAFLADVFEIISTGSVGVRFSRRAGGYFMRFYAASVQLVMGINFGALNNLCFWYGPNVGEENCGKGNATIWFDNTGSAYFGGTLSAGILKNAIQSSIITGGNVMTMGPYTTNGRPKTLVHSVGVESPVYALYSPHSGGPNGPNSPTNPPANPTPPTGTTVSTWRFSRDDGSTWTSLPSVSSQATVAVVAKFYVEPGDDPNLPTGGWKTEYRYETYGSVTATRTEGGTAPWIVEATMGVVPFPNGSGNRSLLSIEEP